MADKSFGVKELNIFGSSGTPTIDSPNDLNLNATTVAISTNLTVGNKLSISAAGIVTAVSGVVTYYGDGSALTGISAGFSQDDQGNLVAGTDAGNALDADTCFNVLLGQRSGYAINSGDANILIGCCSGTAITSGSFNTILGYAAGRCLTGANNNVIIGKEAGNGTGGTDNVFLGRYAGHGVSGTGSHNIGLGYLTFSGTLNSGDYNIALGFQGGYKVTTGDRNISMGYYAGKCVTTGSDNIALGCKTFAGASVTGGCNIALGICAGGSITSGNCNVALGVNAGKGVTSGINNVLIGSQTASSGTITGNNNIALGVYAGNNMAGAQGNILMSSYAGCSITTGACNLILGYESGKQVNTNGYNVFLGSYAARCITGEGNTVVGFQAFSGSGNGERNVAVGRYAGGASTDGDKNVFLGAWAGNTNTTGCCNIAIGYDVAFNATNNHQLAIGSGSSRWLTGDSSFNIKPGRGVTDCDGNTGTSGQVLSSTGGAYVKWTASGGGGSSGTWEPNAQENLVAGTDAGKCLSSDNDCNILIGYKAGCKVCETGGSWGQSSVMIGTCAGLNDTHSLYNIWIGYAAGSANSSGFYNTAIGCNALRTNSSSNCGVALGAGAGYNANGYRNTFLGAYAGCNVTSGCANVAIGPGAQIASATGNNQLVIGCSTSYWLRGDSSFNIRPGAGIVDCDGNTGSSGQVLSSTGSVIKWTASGGGGSGLSHWTESGNTSSPNGTIAANRFLATGSCTNIDAVIQPKGTGSFLAQLPDSTTAGGNKRGQYSVDLQMKRDNAACVADEDYSVITGGENNYVDSCYATVGGGYGNCAGYMGSVNGGCNNKAGGNWGHVGGGHGNQASYAGVVAGGQSNNAGTYGSVLGGSSNSANGYGAVSVAAQGGSAAGDRATVMGTYSCTRGRAGSIAIGAQCGVFSGTGKIQYSIINLGVDTTDATQVALRSKSNAAGTDNQLTIPVNSAYLFTGTVIANVTSGGNTHAWEFKGAMKRGGSNVSLIGTPSINNVAYDSGASAWSIALAADTTNQALAVCVTGQASTSIRWVATLNTTELTY